MARQSGTMAGRPRGCENMKMASLAEVKAQFSAFLKPSADGPGAAAPAVEPFPPAPDSAGARRTGRDQPPKQQLHGLRK